MNNCLINSKEYFLTLLFVFLLYIFFTGKTYATEINYDFAQCVTASVAFLNQGADAVADKGAMTAVSSVALNSIGNLSLFGTTFIGKSKCKMGSQGNHIDLIVTFLVVGLVKSFNTDFGKLTLGPFFEHGISSCDGYRDLSITGLGNLGYSGGGLLGHIDFSKNFYSELSGKVGFNQTDFAMEFSKIKKYDYRALYMNCHVGSGYVFKINNILKFDTYSKYFFTHKFSKNVYLKDDTFFRFLDINSQRIRIGTRISYIFNKHAVAYCGAAYEYITTETIGIKKGLADSFYTLKGGRWIGEIGVFESFKDFYFGLSGQCYICEQSGVLLMLGTSFDLFSRIEKFLGYSSGKFYSKKTKRFSKNFKMSKKKCFDKTLEIIKKLKARVTHKSFDKGYIIAFNFAKNFDGCCLDSTEVGIFITGTSSESIIVEVCSENNILCKKFSVKFFEMLIEKFDDLSKEDNNKNNG
ncbi:MAG: hypothetical protein LBL02_02725 [Endomicrobium sp.]|jgi:hypothetical protein|nr:hypothetical protein [Endomicrobium sp.]